MIKNTFFFLLVGFVFITGCEKSPFVSKDAIQHIRDSIANAKSIEHICFIYNNDVYYLSEISSVPQKITNSPTSLKTKVKISHDYQKIAYLNASGNPVIIDRAGSVLNVLTQYSGIKEMDWSNDDMTLYMLIGNQLYYFGPTINHPVMDIPSPIPTVGANTTIVSVSISKDNDLAYVVNYFHPTYGEIQHLVLKKNDGLNSVNVLTNNDYPVPMKYVHFSVNRKDLVVGYDDPLGSSFTSSRIKIVDVYENLSIYPSKRISLNGTAFHSNPIYRGDKNCLLSAYNPNTGFSSDPNFYYISAYFTNDGNFKSNTNYNSLTSDLIIDWK